MSEKEIMKMGEAMNQLVVNINSLNEALVRLGSDEDVLSTSAPFLGKRFSRQLYLPL